MTFLFGAALVLILALQVWTLHKLRKVHVWTFGDSARRGQDASAAFAQMEALLGLYEALKPGFALPPTRGWAASPDFLRQLVFELESRKPSCVVECSSGVSTVVIASWLRRSGTGHVYSLENDVDYAEKTRGLLRRHGLDPWASVLDAPLTEIKTARGPFSWYTTEHLASLQAIDLLVIDGPPESTGRLARYPAAPVLFGKLTDGAVVLLDDADREDEKATVGFWVEEFPTLVAESIAAEKGLVRLVKS